MKRLIRLVAPGLPLLLALASGVFAQTQITTGVIQGTVLDEQGGVVPGANVEVKNPGINFSRTLTTNGDGRFVFLQLSSGRYTLTVSKQGFATVIQENLNLTVGQAISLSLNMMSTPGLFNFDGFLRVGVGDPRQVQVALKFVF